MIAKLIARTGPLAGQDFALADTVRIGAAKGSEVRLRVEGVSRTHARMYRDGDAYWLEDAGSTNGTFLNGQRVQRERLRHLDVVTLGRNLDLIFLCKEGDAPAATARPGVLNASLVWLDGPEASATLEIARGELTIGRASSCNIVVESAAVSKVHARIIRSADQLTIQDLASANGTFVNGQRVASVQVLTDKDRVGLAGVRNFLMQVERDPASAPPMAISTADSTPGLTVSNQEWKTRLVWSAEEMMELEAARQQLLAAAAATAVTPAAAPAAKPGAAKPPAPSKGAAPPAPPRAAAQPPAAGAAPAAKAPPPVPPRAAKPAEGGEVKGPPPVPPRAAGVPPPVPPRAGKPAEGAAPPDGGAKPPPVPPRTPGVPPPVPPRAAGVPPAVPPRAAGVPPPVPPRAAKPEEGAPAEGGAKPPPPVPPRTPGVPPPVPPRAAGVPPPVPPRNPEAGQPTPPAPASASAAAAGDMNVPAPHTSQPPPERKTGPHAPVPPAPVAGEGRPIRSVRLSGSLGTFTLEPGTYTVGRSDKAEIRLDDREVSRAHAILIVSPTSVSVEDQKSANGTFVNGVEATTRRTIRHGDKVMFGSLEFSVEIEN